MATKFYDGALASGANNGSSWEDAYRTFQAAVDGCGVGDEVWGKANSETVAATVDIDNANAPNFYGGFAVGLTGTSGSVAGRDLTTARTTLNGNSARKILAITRNCTFSGFKVYNGDGTPGGASIAGTITVTFSKCDFVDNQGSYQGGAVLITSATTVTFEDTTFDGNFGPQYGGALHIASTPTVNITRCTFTDNLSTYAAAAINKAAAAVLTVIDTTFTGNIVSAGGIYGGAGAVQLIGASVSLFTRCRFINNVQGNADAWGGAVQVDGSTGGGSAIGRFVNCIFSGNEAAYGGAFIVYQGTGQLTNCIIANNNSTADGGGISAYGSTTATNCIVWGNTAGGSNPQIDNGGATPTVTYSDVQGSYTGTGNVDSNPNFLGTGNDPYNFGASTSGAIDSANAGATYYPTTDILSQARVDYSTVTNTGAGSPAYSDMGAYEKQEAAPPSTTTAKLLLLFN